MHLLSPNRRSPRRSHEWSAARAVNFIVTLAATRSVTLAARAACMSRKSAYALKSRDPAFAAAWAAAEKAGVTSMRPGPALDLPKGDKVEEVEDPPVSPPYGYASPSRRERERAFVRLLTVLRETPPLADLPPAQ